MFKLMQTHHLQHLLNGISEAPTLDDKDNLDEPQYFRIVQDLTANV